ncbi:M24 family metallopeptidase [Desulfobacula sp.]|uniref:M24 family metallopeptidase n=1 Tax=Desulfobacula sp. TaxID=2593537 RepID=UPI0027145CD9|nr:Xaa-Pro peptidase family protein [Desulfobacula sp.]
MNEEKKPIQMHPEPQFAPPSVEEIQGRIARVQTRMEKEKIDCYVTFSPDNIFYLTNFANLIHERPFILVVPKSGVPRFLVPKLEVPHAKNRVIGDIEIVSYFEFPAPAGETWIDNLHPLLSDGTRFGVESVCPLQIYEAIPKERVQTDIIDDLRMIKSEYEVGRIAYACALATEAHNRILAQARPGLTLSEISSEINKMMMGQILSDYPSTNILATRLIVLFQPGSVSDDPHNYTNVNMAMEVGGPHVSIISAVINGSGAEVERTFFLGHVPEKAKRPFEVMLEARRVAFELAVPGNLMSEVDRRTKEVFRKSGYEEFILHRTGHGIGVTGHEAPFLAEGYERMIEPGMFFSIEPGVYLPGVGGFRHSDTVMITDNGNIMLTDGPIQIEELTFPTTV